ncbi:hypothetical protein PAPYR_6263 [Paratrimastix pyriformis]|uniref:Uncharacterized protein n=1 Tax=Paratrimastix pyriformis TaxID=342808 RepID=A0ABQ8UFW4_9EUKA|nr:hypothetical protein PAPYR_6263 [Paratrimastix pyriformis]
MANPGLFNLTPRWQMHRHDDQCDCPKRRAPKSRQTSQCSVDAIEKSGVMPAATENCRCHSRARTAVSDHH